MAPKKGDVKRDPDCTDCSEVVLWTNPDGTTVRATHYYNGKKWVRLTD